MRTILGSLLLLLVLSGCAGYQPEEAPEAGIPAPIREVSPPVLRYRITYQNRGVKVVPDFAGIDRNGEYVVAPELSSGRPARTYY
jgi:hypothetical protein